MSSVSRDEQGIFENEVRRISRQLWPQAEYSGAALESGRQTDGVFETEDCVHLVEATVSRSKNKAIEDAKKLITLVHKYQKSHQAKAIKGWFVTKHEPTADQRHVINQYHNLIAALSFAQLQSRLIDVGSYLTIRENYQFGSVRDPATGNLHPSIDYVPLDLLQNEGERLWSTAAIKQALLDGKRFVLLGDYGTGKSMTLREIYKELKKSYLRDRTPFFPIYLNLRDHIGQTNAAEVLERHGRNIGFPDPAHLVRAWRAGYVILLLDGFDEMAVLGIQGLWKKLQDTRFRAMQVLREFIKSQPAGSGLILSGRAHFFDSEKEMKNGLSLVFDFFELTLNEFNEEQIKRYLTNCGLPGVVPSWMPSRPLLVGYLAASGLLKDILQQSHTLPGQETDPAKGWNYILDRVCARESEIEAGIDGPTVRQILERLATVARATQSGLGPLTRDQVVAAFTDICGYQPDDKGMLVLQRLPGLGIDRPDEGTRILIDQDLSDACRAGDLVAYAKDPYVFPVEIFRGAECGLGALGIAVAAIKAQEAALKDGKINAVLQRTQELQISMLLVLDLANVALELGFSIEKPLQIRDIFIPNLELNVGAKDCSGLHFQDCYFSRVEIDVESDSKLLPRFEACYIGELDGRSSKKDLPKNVFDDKCEFEKFSDATETINAITRMDLPLGTKVLLTILKKIYIQSGSGRKENALHRGLDHNGRRLVPQILHMLQAERLVFPYRRGGLNMTIWVPDRAQKARVGRIIASPHTCNDKLIQASSNVE